MRVVPGRGRARALTVASLLCGASLVLSACGSSAPHALSAKALMDKALRNAQQQSWVHEVATETSGKFHLKTDNVIGANSGRQSLQVAGANATILFVGGVVYVKGNELALIHDLGVSTKHAKKYAGKWISVLPKNSGFTQLSATITLTGDFAQYKLTGTLVKGASTELDGQKVTPITGTVNGSAVRATMYVTTGTNLPIEITANAYKSSITWDRWNVATAISAPSSSTPLSVVDA